MKKRFIKNRRLFFARRIILDYLLIILVASLLLYSTYTTKDGNQISYIDSLFTSVSALTDTSLKTLEVYNSFNFFGQFIVLVLIQIGGFGIMAVKILILMFFQKKVSISTRMMVQAEYNLSFKSGIVKRIRTSFIVILIIEVIFTFVFSIHMMVVYDYSILDSLWFSTFQSISSVNNGGFSLTMDSLTSFSTDYLFQIYTMILIIIGGIGFPFIYEIVGFFKSRINKTTFRFSLFAKVNIATYMLLLVFGFLLIYILEYNKDLIGQLSIENIFKVLFQVVSSRSGGFYTHQVSEFNQASIVVLMILMFIGTSPASCGGGIRTTTFAIIILYLYNFMRSKENIEVFNRRIAEIVTIKSFNVFVVSLFMVISASLIISISDPQLSYLIILFDTVSAFGTSGLALGVLDDLSMVGKITIIVVMIVGHLGITNTLLFFGGRATRNKHVKSVEENLILG
ncbi:MAG: potassium transporter TrkG [Erysipelotrichales bacterium]